MFENNLANRGPRALSSNPLILVILTNWHFFCFLCLQSNLPHTGVYRLNFGAILFRFAKKCEYRGITVLGLEYYFVSFLFQSRMNEHNCEITNHSKKLYWLFEAISVHGGRSQQMIMSWHRVPIWQGHVACLVLFTTVLQTSRTRTKRQQCTANIFDYQNCRF